jgi:hypothetical protein
MRPRARRLWTRLAPAIEFVLRRAIVSGRDRGEDFCELGPLGGGDRRWPAGGDAAVDDQVVAGDEARGVACELERRLGDVLG